ncbi:MAG: ATP-dependent metallopeptidase FtsH/Yme1/Tma family protein, partial [Actinomycetota bacterium]
MAEGKERRSSKLGPGKDVGPVGPGRPGDVPENRWRGLGWLAAALAIFFLAQALFFPSGGRDDIPFSRFLSLAEDGRVTEANISSGTVEGAFEGSSEDSEATDFTTTIPPNYETNDLVDLLLGQGVEVTATQPSAWAGALLSLLPFLVILGIYFFIMRRMRSQLGGGGAGPLSFGKNKAKLYDRTDLKTTFADVAGVDEVETELQELVEYLSKPQKFQRIGARIPKGVLLVGPPGTGKTLLARAVAGEANVPFFYISAAEFIEMFVGLGAARVRDLFKQARERAPAIVFIDEIDSIGQSRSGAAGNQLGAHQEQEQTLQQLLTEMDGFEPNSGV